MVKRLLELGLLCGALILVFTRAHTVYAATITVDSTDQEVPFVVNGNCTLGEAIVAADANIAIDGCAGGSGVADTIIVPSGTYIVNASGTTNDPFYDSSLAFPPIQFAAITIVGAGADQTIIQGAPVFPYELRFFSNFSTLTLDGITLRGGVSNSGSTGDLDC